MRINKNRLLISLILLAITTITISAATSFTVNAPRRVAVGEKFAVTFRLKDGEGTSLKVPQINGCKLLYGPSTSTSQSYTVINGQMSSSSSVDYTYYYAAEKEGSYTIGEATITCDGKRLATDPVPIQIVAASEESTQRHGNSRQPVIIDDITTQSSDRPVSANDVFIRIILSKNNAYEQEAVECTIKLYTKYQISEFFCTKQPSFEGFLIEDLDFTSSLNRQEEYNGQTYMTALLKKCILFPQKAGKLTITSGNYDLKVMQYDMINMGFFSVPDARERKIQVNSNSASINISPLPAPQPDGFTGAVGKFSIDSRLVGNNFRTNEPATLIYTITGTGNIKYLKEPAIDFPTEFEQYTPNVDIDARIAGNNVTGTMTVEYTFVPKAVGNFTIGSDKFVYFDVNTHQYVTLDTPAYDIKVVPGINGSTSERQEISSKNTDILHIKPDVNISNSVHYYLDSTLYWAIYILVIAILITVIIVYRRNIRRAADVRGMKLAKANKVARKRLKLARTYMQRGDSEKFYEELLRALWGYLSDKLSIPSSQLSRDNISAELHKFGASAELSEKFISLLDECEMARYAPTATQTHLEQLYDQASGSINELENVKH